jgi:hypothetical protein
VAINGSGCGILPAAGWLAYRVNLTAMIPGGTFSALPYRTTDHLWQLRCSVAMAKAVVLPWREQGLSLQTPVNLPSEAERQTGSDRVHKLGGGASAALVPRRSTRSRTSKEVV